MTRGVQAFLTPRQHGQVRPRRERNRLCCRARRSSRTPRASVQRPLAALWWSRGVHTTFQARAGDWRLSGCVAEQENRPRPGGHTTKEKHQMIDAFAKSEAVLRSLEEEQRERYSPKARPTPEPVSPAQAYLDHLNASRGPTIAVDVGWLR